MMPIDVFSLIPDDLKKQARDSLVDFISDQAKKYLSDEVSNKVTKLRSDASFRTQFEECLQRAVQRFVNEYELEDEDLVSAISQDKLFFANHEIQSVLLQIIKRPGTFLIDEHDAITQSFESVLPERRNRERVDRAVNYLLKCLVQEVWHLPELQPIYSLQFQRITAESARQQVELQKSQLLALTEMNAGVKDALLQLTTAMEKKFLTSTAGAPVLPHPKPYHNLPRPDYSRFIGRSGELDWLRARLMPDDRAWQIAITGIGGVGKSALALTIAQEYIENYDKLLVQQRFDAIVWISAKEEVLTVSGKERANLPELVLRTLEDVYAAIARVLEREDILRALSEEQGGIVEKALKEKRTLLIMDNLESVKDDRIKPFLRNLPSPTKAVITSREWLEVADILSLKGLSKTDAVQFIADECKLRGFQLVPDESLRLYDLTSGIPLPLKLAIARISGGESFNAVTRWLGNAVGDLPEYCIQGQVELACQRDSNIYKLLLACSLFDRGAGAPRDSLGYIADLSIADRDSGLAQLRKLFLINQTDTDRFWVLPIVQRFAQSKFQEPEFAFITSRWLDWLVTFSKEYASDLEWNAQNIKSVRLEYPNLLEAVRWCVPQSDYHEKLVLLANNAWAYPRIIGSYNELKEVIDAGLIAAKSIQSEFYETRFLRLTGLAYWLQDQYHESLAVLDEAESLATQSQNFEEILECWYLRVHILVHQDIQLAESYITRTNELLGKIDDKTIALRLRVRLAERNARVEYRKGNIDRALELANDVIALSEPTGQSRSLAWGYYFRGTMLSKKKQYIEAEKALLQCIEMGKIWEEQRLVAFGKRRLAWLYSETERGSSARIAAEEAIEIFKRLDLKDEVIELEGLLKNI